MNRNCVLLAVLIALSALSFTPIENPIPQTSTTTVKWLTWEEAMAKSADEPRKIFINVYTEWCGWCKRLDHTTLADTAIASYINEHFYPVKLDAEYQEELIYKGKTYSYVKSGKKGYHQLAAELLKGRMSYPSMIFLDEEQQVIQSIVGFKSPAQFERIATYFAKNHYMETPWSIYKQTYEPLLIKE
jgi:thioredoxin-related protein